MKNLVLNNGVLMPAIGFGTYAVVDGDGEDIIKKAVEVGYRMFDTAAFYDNEIEVGNALRNCGVERSELFVTSKVWRTNLGYDNVRASFEESVKRLGFDYLDMFLLHWPREDADNPEWKTIIQESWRALEDLYEEGKIKVIGLSNFLPHHLDVILEKARIKPAVNQLELHVGYLQETAVNYSRENGIVLQAWSPLGRMRVSKHKTVTDMAEKYGVTAAQLLLAFLYNEGYCVIPKTSSVERLKENLNIEDINLTREDTFILKTLPQLGWSGEHPDFVEG